MELKNKSLAAGRTPAQHWADAIEWSSKNSNGQIVSGDIFDVSKGSTSSFCWASPNVPDTGHAYGCPANSTEESESDARLAWLARPPESGVVITGVSATPPTERDEQPGPACFGLYCRPRGAGEGALGMVTVAHGLFPVSKLWGRDSTGFFCVQPSTNYGGRAERRPGAPQGRNDRLGKTVKHLPLRRTASDNIGDAVYVDLEADIYREIRDGQVRPERMRRTLAVFSVTLSDRRLRDPSAWQPAVPGFQRALKRWVRHGLAASALPGLVHGAKSAQRLRRPGGAATWNDPQLVAFPNPFEEDKVVVRVMDVLGHLGGMADAVALGTEVMKEGPTTGLTRGRVVAAAGMLGFRYSTMDGISDPAGFPRLLLVASDTTDPFAGRGDSGAIVMTRMPDKRLLVVGMVLGVVAAEGRGQFTVVQPLHKILDELGVEPCLGLG